MSGLRDTIGQVVGKQIDHVFARVMRGGRQELYLHFTDDSTIEIYGTFQCSSRLRMYTITDLFALCDSQRDQGPFDEYPARSVPDASA